MPSKRQRINRRALPSQLVQALLTDQPIEPTPENRVELEAIVSGGFSEWPGEQYPFLVGWAVRRLERWEG